MFGFRFERDGFFSVDIVFGDDYKFILLLFIKQFVYVVGIVVGNVISVSCNFLYVMELGSKIKQFQEKLVDEVVEKVNDEKLNDFIF